MQEHEQYMMRCLDLAQLAIGSVSPNPMVGALLVQGDRVVAENYHRRYGEPHAEALVIREVLEKYGETKSAQIFAESTLYVNLEPCSHQGKTPPCADLIIRHRIPRVVIGMRDPSDKVNGQGVDRLRAAGIEVIEQVLEEDARWLNRRFETRVRLHRPYIILKWAQTADGFMAPLQQVKRWITGPEARQLVHRWRSEEDAVMVGYGTALADNPRLDVRDWEGGDPIRILIDRDLAIPNTAAIFDNFDNKADTLVFNAHKTEWKEGLKYIALENFELYYPQQIVYQLHILDVQSVMVEGGPETLRRFISAGLWDEARILQGAVLWREGRPAPQIRGRVIVSDTPVGQDQLMIVTNPAVTSRSR